MRIWKEDAHIMDPFFLSVNESAAIIRTQRSIIPVIICIPTINFVFSCFLFQVS